VECCHAHTLRSTGEYGSLKFIALNLTEVALIGVLMNLKHRRFCLIGWNISFLMVIHKGYNETEPTG
jgi:hypothetical protein